MIEELILYVVAFVAAVVLIGKAGDVFVSSSCGIARALGVSQAVVALTLIAFATSAPEFFTSTIAAALGEVEISYANVVGSNIINISLVLGLAAVFGAVNVNRERLKEGTIMLGIGIVLVLMALDGEVSAIEGVVLLLIFVLFLKFVWGREANRGRDNSTRGREGLGRLFLLFVVGATGTILGAWLLVYSGAGFARVVGVPESAIGFTLVAVGTSLPELATIIIASAKRLPEISAGTVIGSNIFNAALVIGCASVIRPLRVDHQAIWFSNPMMLIAMLLLLGFMWTGLKLSRREGIGLLAFYVFYLAGLAFLYAP
ncbi:MAG: calcium/sodium antiporter [Hadesarchaea archaeon]|nr:calcium/sodium antiporter [Hadesarchaea archaeon]